MGARADARLIDACRRCAKAWRRHTTKAQGINMKYDTYGILKELLRATAPLTGAAFFDAANALTCRLLEADFAFIAHQPDAASTKIEVLASHRHDKDLGRWSFDLPGTPCSLLYGQGQPVDWADFHIGGAVSINQDVYRRFESTRNTQYQTFIGIPLRDTDQRMIGHMALFFENPVLDHAKRMQIVELAELFSIKVQAELIRTLSERMREHTLKALSEINQRLVSETTTDHLTDLHNRRYFAQRMREAFGRFRRTGVGYALVILDVDHFKLINDRFGHDAGDMALQHVARVLEANCRANIELLFRIGGEEFAILCQGELTPQSLEQFGHRLNQAFRSSPIQSVGGLSLTVSAGGAFPLREDTSWSDLLKRADAAMYVAKRSGRDRTFIDAGDQTAGTATRSSA